MFLVFYPDLYDACDYVVLFVANESFVRIRLYAIEMQYAVCRFATVRWINTDVVDSNELVSHDYCGVGSFNDTYLKPIVYGLPMWLRLVQCISLYAWVCDVV